MTDMTRILHVYPTLLAGGAFLLIALTTVGGGQTATPPGDRPSWEAASSAISGTTLLEDIKTLSSDEFEGRAPATRGEELTVDFLTSRFKAVGLKPGNPDGTYLQNVPLVGIKADPSAELVFSKADGPGGGTAEPPMGKSSTMHLRFGPDFVAFTRRVEPEVSVRAPLVFVGYGVVAPEYHWDDYKDVDVRGKVLVMLINDPQIPDPHDPGKLDPAMFKGRAMTYYGRWTYKFEMAAARGAAGALIVHETATAGYPWEVVEGSNSPEQFSLVTADRGRSRAGFEGWITTEKARAMFAAAGQDFDALHQAAIRPDFRPVPLGMDASLTLHNTIRTIESHNVVGKLEGSDPRLRDQYVIYSAHWDHLGVGNPVNGDRIYHGAVDNASGASGLIEIARAFAAAEPKPRRSILFLSVTAEEKGLLGSQYYAEHPLYPLRDTLADINMDGLNVLGRTRDITEIGLGNSQLDDYIRQAAAAQGRTVSPDPEPEKGFYFRSDHFNFAKLGVPALDPHSGVDYIGRPEGWGLKQLDDYTANRYHKPADVVAPDWDLSGAVEDLQLFFVVGYNVASAGRFPEWSPDSEFRAVRQAMLKGPGR
jgi:Zn-dependent M28 family amino/carboxypeptidase